MLPICEIGNPILRQIAAPVDDISSIQRLIDDMIETLHEAEGVGLAAPQVGESIQLFVMRIPSEISDQETNPTIVINPTITSQSGEVEMDREGCLSIPGASYATGLKGQVPRPTSIHAQRYDQDNVQHSRTLTGFEARVFLHEYDHLQGVFFVDQMTDMRTLCTDGEYHKLLSL